MIQVVERSRIACGAALLVCIVGLARVSSAAAPLPAEMNDYIEFAHPEMMPDPVVPPAACTSLCCPEWNDYAVFDVLFMQRDNTTNNQPIAIANDNAPNPGQVLMTTRSMEPTVAPGVRLFYGRRTSDHTGWEAGYYGIWGMYGDALTGGVDQILIPGDLGEAVDGFATADLEKADYTSSLNMVELNVFRYSCCGSRDPCARLACKRCYHCNCVDWLAGFRWAGLEEQSTLAITCCEGEQPTPYTTNASTNLFAAQVGVRGRTEWRRFAFEGWIKTAVGGTALYQSQSLIVSPITGEVVRTARSSTAGGMGFIGDINLSAVYRINRVWGLRAGYNMLWLSGMALAPNQWDFTDTADSGLGLDHGAGIFLNGANLGLEARW